MGWGGGLGQLRSSRPPCFVQHGGTHTHHTTRNAAQTAIHPRLDGQRAQSPRAACFRVSLVGESRPLRGPAQAGATMLHLRPSTPCRWGQGPRSGAIRGKGSAQRRPGPRAWTRSLAWLLDAPAWATGAAQGAAGAPRRRRRGRANCWRQGARRGRGERSALADACLARCVLLLVFAYRACPSARSSWRRRSCCWRRRSTMRCGPRIRGGSRGP
jgi:hypothetical protein